MNLICLYHGTKFKYIADKILKNGFKPNTFFAKNLDEAIEFGGKYVFMVAFKESDLPDNWQVRCINGITPDRIMLLTKYESKKLFKNEALRKKIFQLALEEPEEPHAYNFCFNDTYN